MNSIRITNEHSPYFAELWQTYESSFPITERRTLQAQALAFAHPRYRLEAWLSGTSFAGLTGSWLYDNYRFVEHLAVAPATRSKGLGKQLLQQWMNADPRPVYLEIDLVTDDISRRRLHFYQRLGFVENTLDHAQPMFQGGDGQVPLRVLSWPGPITMAQYERFHQDLVTDAWATIQQP